LTASLSATWRGGSPLPVKMIFAQCALICAGDRPVSDD
jgi:hypothetical protein